MLITTKQKSVLKKLIGIIFTLVMCTSGLLIIPKTDTKVSAATEGSSAVLKGYDSVERDSAIGSSWRNELVNPLDSSVITSLRITNDASKLAGYTKSVNVKDDNSSNDIFCYYKAAGYQVPVGIGDSPSYEDGYDVVLYSDVETIYAPAVSGKLFANLSNCKSIVFDNFDTSNVTNMDYMFMGCYVSEPLDLRGFDFSSVTSAKNMFCVGSWLDTTTASSYGLTKDNIVDVIEAPTFLEKSSYLPTEKQNDVFVALVFVAYMGHFDSILAPANLNGLSIDLPCIYDYTDSDGNTKSTSTLVAGKTHTLTSKLPATLSENWLAKVTSVSPSNISSIKFTSNSSAISGFTKGENVAGTSSYADLYYYYKLNSNNKYDIVVYSEVTINAPANSTGLFVNQNTMEGITNCTSIVFENFNTSNVTNMMIMFATCSAVQNLDISGFSFDSVDTTSQEASMLMLGMSPTQCGQMIGLEGDDLDNFVNGTDEERISIIVGTGDYSEEEAPMILQLYITNFSKIIAPTTIPSGLTITLPGEYTYTDASGLTQTTSTLVAGATHNSPNASSDINDTGVVSDSILLSLIALCFVFSGFMLLKKKKVR